MEQSLIEKDRRDAGYTNQSNPTVLGFPMRDQWDRRPAGQLFAFSEISCH